MEPTRKEHDFLGELEIPNHLYYGIQTFRAVENFNITGIPISKEPLFIKALGYVCKNSRSNLLWKRSGYCW
jgi:aspartate ammonia-lyase